MIKRTKKCKRCGKLVLAKQVYCSNYCYKLSRYTSSLREGKCKKHGKVKVYKSTSYGKERFVCSKCNIIHVSKRRKQIKKMSVAYLGGKCEKCGYKKFVEVLEFHHKDPSVKSFTIASSQHIGWEKIRKELDKCQLLCSNCHKETEITLR